MTDGFSSNVKNEMVHSVKQCSLYHGKIVVWSWILDFQIQNMDFWINGEYLALID